MRADFSDSGNTTLIYLDYRARYQVEARMFSSPIGRLRFFLYSVAIALVELLAVILVIAATMGLEEFVNSQPGAPRAFMGGVCLMVLLAFAALRANITWRRGNDAALSKWMIVPYLVLTAFYAVLQAGALMASKFGAGGDSNAGLGILSLSLLALWSVICVAKSKSTTFDPDAFLAAEGFFSGPKRGAGRETAVNVSPSPAMPPPAVPRAAGPAGAITFGKRGLS
uniref:DUF805 domain-containing protein n=1 Tax=Rhodopseudomonas palustris (strain BisA53) TaxID=316055 RepID=Q07J91_RHOP5